VPRDNDKLKSEVREMREKMRAALDTKEANKFDLKQSKGGIADIEFIVQFGVLSNAATHSSLTTYTDNVRLLEGLTQQSFITPSDAAILKTAYCAYRDTGHKQVLQGDKAIINESEVDGMKKQVEEIWHKVMESNAN